MRLLGKDSVIALVGTRHIFDVWHATGQQMPMLYKNMTSMPANTWHLSREGTLLSSHLHNSTLVKADHCPVFSSTNKIHGNAAETQMIDDGGTYRVAGLLTE